MTGDPVSVRDELGRLGEAIREDFVSNRRVMSFAEYLELCAAQPHRQLRSAAHYLRDTFDHFGTRTIEYPWGAARRFVLFDVGGRRADLGDPFVELDGEDGHRSQSVGERRT